jgi:hypothetical protein
MPIFRMPLGGGPGEPVTPPGQLCVAESSLGPGGRLAYPAMDDVHTDQVFVLDPMGRPSNRVELMRRQLDWFRRYLDAAG